MLRKKKLNIQNISYLAMSYDMFTNCETYLTLFWIICKINCWTIVYFSITLNTLLNLSWLSLKVRVLQFI
jgi:hypothetical protein